MTARITMDPGVAPIGKGWRVQRDDGTARMVLPRLSGQGWAVYEDGSTDECRLPDHLGYSGSWRTELHDAVEWARTAS